MVVGGGYVFVDVEKVQGGRLMSTVEGRHSNGGATTQKCQANLGILITHDSMTAHCNYNFEVAMGDQNQLLFSSHNLDFRSILLWFCRVSK